MDHHIDGLHSLTGEISDYASKAHQAVDAVQGGSIGKKVKRGAVIARKGLRTAATVLDATAMPAEMLGMATGNAALAEYGVVAPMAAEVSRVGAYGVGQAVKTL